MIDRYCRIFLEERHQLAVAIGLVVALLGITAYYAKKRVDVGPLVDIDKLSTRAATYQVDLNAADWPELVILPGIGEKLAKSIVEHRSSVGCFESHEEILEITGIGLIKFGWLRPHLLPMCDSD